MSNLNEDDIAEYQEKTKNYGLYEVEQVEILGYENGKKIEPSTWWAVSNRLFPELECYECRNKEVADSLCWELNQLTRDHGLNSELPKPYLLEAMRFDEKTHIFESLASRINEKHELLEKIRKAKNHELTCELDYLHKCNEVKLHPDNVKDSLELSKNPTEKQIQAYCENTYQKEFQLWKIAKEDSSLLNKQLDLINDYLSLEKYIIRMRLK